MRFLACGLVSVGLLAAAQGVSLADDGYRPNPGSATVSTMQGTGNAQTQQVWLLRRWCGCYGGYGGYGCYGGGYGGYGCYGGGYGGYGGYGGGYGGYPYSGYGYGGGYPGYGGYGGGYGGYGGGYGGYGGGYGGYGGGYGGYGGGYGGYGGGYGYTGYGYPGYGYGYGSYGRPVSMASNSSPAPRLTPIVTPSQSTYPYNGGPSNPVPMPGNSAPRTQPQQTIPADNLLVSLPATMSGSVSPMFTNASIRPAVPAPNRYTFRAYGE